MLQIVESYGVRGVKKTAIDILSMAVGKMNRIPTVGGHLVICNYVPMERTKVPTPY